jgi:glycosyltransferase involved in cell wall biosynthesis
VAEQIKGRELGIYERSDVVLGVSEPDQQLLLADLPALEVEIIPNIFNFDHEPVTGERETNNLLFVGNFTHEPNVDGVRYFAREILPLIVVRRPDVRVQIVGVHAPADITSTASQHMDIVGHVQDLESYARKSSISIAPLRFGAGLKGKVGEAMAWGLPVVTTSVGAEGYGATPGTDILIGDTPGEFADAIVKLMNDAELRSRLSQNGRALIQRRFSEDALRPHIFDVFDRVLSRRPKRVALGARILSSAKYQFDQHLGWRLSQLRNRGA